MRRWCTLLACDGLPQARAPRTTLSTVPLQERDRSLDARVTVLLGVDGCIASGARKVALLDLARPDARSVATRGTARGTEACTARAQRGWDSSRGYALSHHTLCRTRNSGMHGARTAGGTAAGSTACTARQYGVHSHTWSMKLLCFSGYILHRGGRQAASLREPDHGERICTQRAASRDSQHAAHNGQPVGMLHIVAPVRKGSQHLGVLMGKEELGQHSPAAALEELGEA